MSASGIEALASAWARIAEEATLPSDYEGTASLEAHRACEAIQAWIRDHIVATNDCDSLACCICLARHRCAWSKRCGRKTSSA